MIDIPLIFSLLHVYVPTFKAPTHVKEKFCNDLKGCLTAVFYSDKLLLLGDFNVRVGYHKCVNDVWKSVLGCHGLVVGNQAVEDFLGFVKSINCPS